MEKYVCKSCGKFTLKQITSKNPGKNLGKKFWVCQAPAELCHAIFPDADGKPEFPEENPGALLALDYLQDDDRQNALSEWERGFVAALVEKAQEQLDSPLTFTPKQIQMLRSITDKFADAPEF